MWSVDITDMQASPFLRPLRNDPRWSETLAIDELPDDRHIQ
jgi:hypothetical protein